MLVRGDIFCQGLKLNLEQWGLEVVEPPSGAGTVAGLTGGREPALVIMDCKSRFSAQEAALLSPGHTVPILFLAAKSEVLESLPIQVQSVNYYCCLPKPCPIGDLQKAVEGLLGIRIAQKQIHEEVIPPFSSPRTGVVARAAASFPARGSQDTGSSGQMSVAEAEKNRH